MQRLRKLSLSTKFTVGMVLVFVIGISASWLVLSGVLQQRAEWYVANKGMALLETMNAVRQYTSAHVNPLLADDLLRQSNFIPETVPAYSAREVFENLRANASYASFLYKEATTNPTNPRDLADDFERDLLTGFQQDTALREVSGFRRLDGGTVFYAARPLALASQTCLGCHGQPGDAPASLINSYGDAGGFGWALGDIMAAQVIYVPADEVLTTAQRSLTLVMAAVLLIFALLVLVVNALLRRTVLRPVMALAELAEKVSADAVRDEDIHEPGVERASRRGDELGRMARLFQRMAANVAQREKNLRERVRTLQIEIDRHKQQQEIDEIVNTDYFQRLREKVAEKRQGHDAPGALTEPPTPRTDP